MTQVVLFCAKTVELMMMHYGCYSVLPYWSWSVRKLTDCLLLMISIFWCSVLILMEGTVWCVIIGKSVPVVMTNDVSWYYDDDMMVLMMMSTVVVFWWRDTCSWWWWKVTVSMKSFNDVIVTWNDTIIRDDDDIVLEGNCYYLIMWRRLMTIVIGIFWYDTDGRKFIILCDDIYSVIDILLCIKWYWRGWKNTIIDIRTLFIISAAWYQRKMVLW